MKKLSLNILLLLGIFAFAIPSLQSCNDEPDASNFYSFTGQMMSEYLTENAQYSQFADIVTRAGLMDQLSAYGHYTCFVPTNDAINEYLAKKNKTMETLTQEDCDTLARTHLVNVMYSVSEMGGENSTSVLPTQNMMHRNLQITHDTDNDGNSVVVVNGKSVVFFEHQDDSVENGIMQPVSAVIENSTLSVPSLLESNPEISLYCEALKATKLDEKLEAYKDNDYDPKNYYGVTGSNSSNGTIQYTTGGNIKEVACLPDQKLYGFTAFVFKNDMMKNTYHVETLRQLYDLACSIYDEIYPDDVNDEAHSFDHLDNPKNPLYRFMAYHLLDRNVQGYNYLTVRDDVGVDTKIANTTDWYTTMLPHTMIKVERLNVQKWLGYGDVLGDRYINRRYDDNFQVKGVHVQPTVDGGYVTDGNNGVYFYVDDILKYDSEVRNTVQNTRIRMDFSTIFPEIMSNNIRMNGDYLKYDNQSIYDDSYKYGKNYYFPQGYLKNVEFSDNNTNGHFVYRRPRSNYYSMHGDEMIANGVFDLTFVIPPVPFDGEWQIRLGFAPMDASQGASRGIFQIYFDGKAQGIPLNMDERINSSAVYGATSFPDYLSIRDDDEKRAEDFKILKNKGYYRGPYSIFHDQNNNVNTGERFAKQPSTVRKVLCTVNIKAGKEYKLRIRNVSTFRAKEKEAMLDYLELVPKSVYGVTDGANAEDDL